jgi:hypothetical protein
MERLEHAVFGNGRPGIQQTLSDFISRWDERENVKAKGFIEQKGEQERREHNFNRRTVKITILISILGLLVAAASAGLAIYWHHLEKNHTLTQTSGNQTTADARSTAP